ncbi:hypothetical protein [Trichocoleus sp. FACHB-90]|uniref:hypothetical protein n=1 Tax=Cyanophyceae TaxID=3028117 RepID=UPI00321F8667
MAYGSAVLVTEALLAAARMETGVLSSPPPKVWFKAFGESSLDFELVLWIDQPQNSEPIKSSLNFLIEHEFRYRGIEIPFPQRDVTIRNLEKLENLFQKHNAADVSNGINSQNGAIASNNKLVSKSPDNWTLRDLLRRVAYFEGSTDLELRQLIEYGYRQLFPN